jgi:hypothetical protein
MDRGVDREAPFLATQASPVSVVDRLADSDIDDL